MSVTLPDPSRPLTPSGNLRRRLLLSRLLQCAAVGAATLAVAVLVVLVGFTFVHGVAAMSWKFLTTDLPAESGTAGGIGPAIVGTLELAAIGGFLAVTVGVLTAVFLTESTSTRAVVPVRMALDMMTGLPAIIAGIFMFLILVQHFGQSVIAGAIGIAIVMTPLITRGSFEALRRVPDAWREAADALGVARWRTVVGIVLPGASTGIVTASVLAIALGAGETAPLLFTDSIYGQTLQANPLHAAPNLPFTIFTMMENGYPPALRMAWGAAFLLMVVILCVNVTARIWLRRSERKRGLL